MDLRELETPLPQSQPPPDEPEEKGPPSWLVRWTGLRGRFELTPINLRRLANLKANKRGYWSLIIFSILFVLSLFGEFIANDRPIIVSYKGEILSPFSSIIRNQNLTAFSPSRTTRTR